MLAVIGDLKRDLTKDFANDDNARAKAADS